MPGPRHARVRKYVEPADGPARDGPSDRFDVGAAARVGVREGRRPTCGSPPVSRGRPDARCRLDQRSGGVRGNARSLLRRQRAPPNGPGRPPRAAPRPAPSDPAAGPNGADPGPAPGPPTALRERREPTATGSRSPTRPRGSPHSGRCPANVRVSPRLCRGRHPRAWSGGTLHAPPGTRHGVFFVRENPGWHFECAGRRSNLVQEAPRRPSTAKTPDSHGCFRVQ